VRLFGGVNPRNFRAREWRRICGRAGIGHRAPKDLRDTFASQLLTAGVQLGYVSQQLGHSDVSVTARHYARWAGGDEYRAPLTIESGEVPADLLARLVVTVGDLNSHHIPTSDTELSDDAFASDSGNTSDDAGITRRRGGDPGAIRTRDPQLRRLVLYPD